MRVVTWFDGDLLFTMVEKRRISEKTNPIFEGDFGGPKGPQSQPAGHICCPSQNPNELVDAMLENSS